MGEMQQEILVDVRSGKRVQWRMRYRLKRRVSEAYGRLSQGGKVKRFARKAVRVSECASWLDFKKFEDGTRKLHQADFCRVPLCPMCAWRRSLKIFNQVSSIMRLAQADKEYRYLFLTLTARNVRGDELGEEITCYLKAFKRLTERKSFEVSVKGWFRALEITRNAEADTYHPHIHVVLAVNKSYFTDKLQYHSHDDWVSLWRSCLRIDYDPIVDIRVVKPKPGKTDMGGAVAEVAKYAVKPEALDNDSAIGVLDYAIHKRRLIAFGGSFKDLHKRLNLDDAVDGDMVHVDTEEVGGAEMNYILERYHWQVGFAGANYYRVG